MGFEVKRFGFKDRLLPNQLTMLGPSLLIGRRQDRPLRAVMKMQLRHRGQTCFVSYRMTSNTSLTQNKRRRNRWLGSVHNTPVTARAPPQLYLHRTLHAAKEKKTGKLRPVQVKQLTQCHRASKKHSWHCNPRLCSKCLLSPQATLDSQALGQRLSMP